MHRQHFRSSWILTPKRFCRGLSGLAKNWNSKAFLSYSLWSMDPCQICRWYLHWCSFISIKSLSQRTKRCIHHWRSKDILTTKWKEWLIRIGRNAKHVMRTTKKPNKQVITTLFWGRLTMRIEMEMKVVENAPMRGNEPSAYHLTFGLSLYSITWRFNLRPYWQCISSVFLRIGNFCRFWPY